MNQDAGMRLIVGLGNPGRRYNGTRHNVGFEVVAELARRHGLGAAREKFQGEIVEARIANRKTLLLCPLTYMNESGASVQPTRDFYKLELDQLIVVCDDFQLPVARLRFRARGSAGGQKGLQNVIRRLGSQEFPRLRIGVGPLPPERDVSAFVLSRFAPEDREAIDLAVKRAADALEDWVAQDVAFCMNRYNGQ